MRIAVMPLIFLLLYLLILPGFTRTMQDRPAVVKLGYVPHPQMIRLIGGEFAPVMAEMTVLDVVFYFGTLVDKWSQKVSIPPEYPNMHRALVTASEIDPYNQDVYYFAQAIFTWDVGRVREVNQLLAQGMRYRTWDPWLPFYAGFNCAYFLKDYDHAARYMEKAAMLSGDALRVGLASRFFYESKQTALGLSFLDLMIAREKNPAVKKTYELRRTALVAVDAIEKAAAEYLRAKGRQPAMIEQLVIAGFLPALPEDPYGGRFYLDASGRVRSTSKFSIADKRTDGLDHE